MLEQGGQSGREIRGVCAMSMRRPVHCRPAAYEFLAAHMPVIESTDGLLGCAVAISMHQLERVDFPQLEADIEGLARLVRDRVKSRNPNAVVAHLHELLFDEMEFAGNVEDYYNPGNSYLPRIMETHRGIPISLALLYKCVGERAGLRVYGIGSPGHFLAGVDMKEALASDEHPTSARSLMLVDPFLGGVALSFDEAIDRIAQMMGGVQIEEEEAEDMLPVSTHREWIMRMIQNLINVFGSTGRHNDLAAMLEMRSLVELGV